MSSDVALKSHFEPAYLKLARSGELKKRVRLAKKRMESCDLCARYCRVNRYETVRGAACRTGEHAIVSTYFPHHGEEDCLRGSWGSGTIYCNMRCSFCQNWEISWKGEGEQVSPRRLAQMMLELQRQDCHNINFVSPSHVIAQILEAVELAAERGLQLPLVYNTGGYDSLEGLALLDGLVDIYLIDMKYGQSDQARKFSHVREYVGFNRAAIQEMYRQVGDLELAPDGLARRGIIVRHLLLPNNVAGTEEVIRFLAEEISPNTFLNLMDQYRPAFKACGDEMIGRSVEPHEYQTALDTAKSYGLRLDPRSIAPKWTRWF
jgi:putative pyruvate formate lyase activating enzyme